MPYTTVDNLDDFIKFHQSLNVESHSAEFMRQNKLSLDVFDRFDISSYVYDFSTQSYAYVSPVVKKITGYSAEEFMEGGLEFFAKMIHPEDLPQVFNVTSKFLDLTLNLPGYKRLKAKGKLSYRIIRADGEIVNVLQNAGLAAVDKNGMPAIDFGFISNLNYIKKDFRVNASFSHPDRGIIAVIPDIYGNEFPKISDRELSVISRLKVGLTSKQVAEEFNLSPETINRHRKNILKKLKASNMIEAIRIVNEAGML